MMIANGRPSQMTAEEMPPALNAKGTPPNVTQVMRSKSLEVKFQKEFIQLECGHESRYWMQKRVLRLHIGAESDPED